MKLKENDIIPNSEFLYLKMENQVKKTFRIIEEIKK